MFMRKHQIGNHNYIEVLESYRDPVTHKPKHRIVARVPDVTGYTDIRRLLRYHRSERLRLRADLRYAENNPPPTDATSAWIARRERILRVCGRREAQATAFVAALVKMEAGRSGNAVS